MRLSQPLRRLVPASKTSDLRAIRLLRTTGGYNFDATNRRISTVLYSTVYL